MRTSDLDTPDLNKSKMGNNLKVLLAIVVLLGIIGLVLLATGAFDDDDLCASVTCPDASGVCKVAGSCQPVSGTCSTETNVSNGTLCDDNDPATTGTVCTAGVCGAAADDANDDAADDAADYANDDANDDAADDANVDCAFAWSQCSVHCGRRFNSDATDEQRSVCPEPPCLAGDGACPDAPNVDCAGTWSPCTTGCEKAHERQWTETAPQSGSGAACPLPQDCQIGEGACLDTWTLSEPAQSCTDACTALSGSCTPESHNNLSSQAPITSIINDVLGDQLAGITTEFWISQQAYIPIVSGNFEKIVYNNNADATFNCEVDAPTHIVEGVGDWRRICHCL